VVVVVVCEQDPSTAAGPEDDDNEEEEEEVEASKKEPAAKERTVSSSTPWYKASMAAASHSPYGTNPPAPGKFVAGLENHEDLNTCRASLSQYTACSRLSFTFTSYRPPSTGTERGSSAFSPSAEAVAAFASAASSAALSRFRKGVHAAPDRRLSCLSQ